ncbi:MAG: electron-transfer flavoprotein:ubiquinone oxidoreductase [Dehalococcoidales bacterium]|nr:electron-transfer flavoprotein:ubiquinone oxidoreductase [Dehalococcoidales bacterium]
MDELNKIDVLFIGGGPAGLAGAIRLKQLLNERGISRSVVVIDKAEKPGQHSLSGAVFEADVLDELLPEWKEDSNYFVTKMIKNRVEREDIVFLNGEKRAVKLPKFIIPSYMNHSGEYMLSLNEMVTWLTGIAKGLGVEIYNGFAAKELLIDDGKVKGVILGEKGLNKEGSKQSNYIPGEVLEADITVLAEGSLGQLAEKLVKNFNLQGENPQIHSLGVKEIIKLPENNTFGSNRLIHTMGFPDKDIFGGGALYSMDSTHVAVALVLALDWKYPDLNPQQELQYFKSHRLISELLKGGEVIAYGAKTLPEGGYYSISKLIFDGVLIIGDDAGFTNVRKLKGLHYAIKSGILAAETIIQAIEKQDYSKKTLELYEKLLDRSFIMKDLRNSKNYRQVFRRGMLSGLPLSLLANLIPGRCKLEPDYKGMKNTLLKRKYVNGVDRLTAVSYSRVSHREDEPSHINLNAPEICSQCAMEYGVHPCEYFCPAAVYKQENSELIISYSNCINCQTCRVKCPMQNINWEIPEGGDGPRYKKM